MQTVKTLHKQRINSRAIALSAMLAAMVTVSTAFIKIPAPLGYAHAGDAVVYLSACLLPAPLSFLAAGIGGVLADILSGYAVWALPTALIKMANVLPFFIARMILKNKDRKLLNIGTLAALLPSAGVTVGGYYLADWLLYDRAAALAEIPFNVMQALVGTVLFIALGIALDAVKLKQRIWK